MVSKMKQSLQDIRTEQDISLDSEDMLTSKQSILFHAALIVRSTLQLRKGISNTP